MIPVTIIQLLSKTGVISPYRDSKMNKPNILFIYSDQHRYDCTGVNGHPLVSTPNMDRIAREGVNFKHAFTPIPMCVPARCSLLSGQFAPRHGVIFNFDGETFKELDPELPTSARTVQMAGYHTIHIGRWHVDPQRTPLDYGFHDYVPGWRYSQWRKNKGIEPTPREGGWRGCPDPYVTPEESSLGWGADRVIEWMEKNTEYTDPFFIRWHMVQPHLACHPCEPFASMYPPEQIDPWPGFSDEFENKPRIQRQMKATWGVEGIPWEQWAQMVSLYLGEISQLDSQIGRVLETLDRLGIADDTLVIYTADHGDMCGSHGMVDKHYIMYDDVVRVPLMMRWPGVIAAGMETDAFVSNAVDLAATFCDAAGADIPESFQGESLLPVLTGRQEGRKDIYSTYSGNQFGSFSQRMVRDDQWKYIWNATEIDELYDLQNDPGELVNRITDPACGKEVTRLRKRLVSWMEKTEDSILNNWTRKMIENERII